MGFRRVLVQAVGDRGASSCTGAASAAAAAVAVQLRSCFQSTPVAQAPRQKSTAKGPKSAATKATTTTTRRKKAKTSAPQQQPAAPPPPSNAESHHLSSQDVAGAPAVPLDAQIDAGTSLSTSAAVDGGDGVDRVEPQPPAEDPRRSENITSAPTAAAAATTAVALSLRPARDHFTADAAARARTASHWYADGWQRRMLVGAHAALEATAACPDPRQHIPRLVTEEGDTTVAPLGKAETVGTSSPHSSRAGCVVHHVLPPLLAEATAPTARAPAKGSAADAKLLPLDSAIRLLADTFGFTLHRISIIWQALAASTTTVNAVLPSTVAIDSSGSCTGGADAVTTNALSFLSSPLSSAAAGFMLANRTPERRAVGIENLAPLHWLENSFCALCRRIAEDVQMTLQTAGEAERGACRAVRAQAAAVLAALEDTAKCTVSRSVLAMRRHVQQKGTRASAASASKRKRKSHHTSAVAAAAVTDNSDNVQDTLLNTVNRVSLELHLLHVWLTRLSSAASPGGAPSVEAVVRQAVRWGAHYEEKNNGGAVPSVEQLEWMLATAMLEQMHVQEYRFHFAHITTPTNIAELATRESARRLYVVEAKALQGLAALVDFALEKRSVVGGSGSGDDTASSEPASTRTPFREALFALLNSFHTVLPVYAVLQPAWQRVLAKEGASAFAAPARQEELHGDGDVDFISLTRAAAPTAVWDVVARRWTREEADTRVSGALAALWWLRMLPLWMNATSCTLQLRIVAAAMRAVVGKAAGSSRVQGLVLCDVVSALETQLERSGELLCDVLRFDRAQYERLLSTTRAAHSSTPSSLSADATRGMMGGDGAEVVGEGEMTGEDGTENAVDGAGNPPPLQRFRGKRSLFYKDADAATHSILHGGAAEDRSSVKAATISASGSSGGRSPSPRFSSRLRHVGSANTLTAAASSDGGSGGHGARDQPSASSSTAEARATTSAIFDVLVVSREASILLTHRFGVASHGDRDRVVEETWAAAARARTELWMMLYALPASAAVEAATTRARNGDWSTAQVLRSCLPPVLRLLLLSALRVAPSTTGGAEGAAASASPQEKRGSDGVEEEEEEGVLREVLAVVASAQQQLGLGVFESLDHLLVALGGILLRICSTAAQDSRSLLSANGLPRRNRELERIQIVLALGANTLLTDSLLEWETVQALWQLRQLHYMPALSAKVDSNKGEKALVSSAVAASAAMNAFATQWTNTMIADLVLLFFRSRQDPAAVLANAEKLLTALREDLVVAALPLYAKQVTLACVLHSLRALLFSVRSASSNASRGRRHERRGTASEGVAAATTTVQRVDIVRVYTQLLDTLAADADARLLCCYAAFVESLFEVHQRLRADTAALVAWADQYLLPLILPVLVAGLRRSLATHSSATHCSVCDAALMLLSPLARYTASPLTTPTDVLQSRWSRVLLQVGLYCIRSTGRGGLKRAADYGMPPVTLPDMTQHVAAKSVSPWWEATFAHGAEAVFLGLLDQSNSVLWQTQPIEPHSSVVADGVRKAFIAYVDVWGSRVRFGRQAWDTAGPAKAPASNATPQALMAWLQRCCADAEAFRAATQPARTAGAEATPFLAANPSKARQLGFLVRFMEHFLREQERSARQIDELPTSATAAATALTPTSQGGAAADAGDGLGEAAAVVLLDFVGHLSSAGGWSVMTWACNVAETATKLELKRHRILPETVRAVAATAILSQIRTVPSPQEDSPLPHDLAKALFTLSDLLSLDAESFFGYPRRSPLHGLFARSTRDQYRVLTFGLKQATAYVQLASRKYRAWQDAAAAADGEEQQLLLQDGDGTASTAAEDEAVAEMSRSIGRYYATLWAAHTARQHGEQVAAAALAELRQDFSYYVNCLVALMDACLEWARLFLARQQGEGEEDLRVVVEAAVTELCRTLAANVQSLLLLTGEQRAECFAAEEAQVLWAALCVASTLSIAIPLDQKERFFTPRCTLAVQRLLERVHSLVERVAAAGDDAVHQKEKTPTRPLCTALVCGVQHLLRGPRAWQRLSIRLALRQREEDDLTAVIDALRIQLVATRSYKPGSALLCGVWERLFTELTQPLPAAAAAAATEKSRFSAAATVASRGEFAGVLRDAVAAYAAQRGTTPPLADVVAVAAKHVVEDAAAVKEDRQRACRLAAQGEMAGDASKASLATSLSAGAANVTRASAPSIPGATSYTHVNIAAALESGTVPLSVVLDAAVAHAHATLTAGRLRAPLWRGGADAAAGGGEDGSDGAAPPLIGAARLLKDYYQDIMDLVTHVPLRELLSHPNAEVLFASLFRLQGVVAADAEDALWRALTARWKEELLAPTETTFLRLQESQLALVRLRRGVQTLGTGNSATSTAAGSTTGQSEHCRRGLGGWGDDTPPLDIFSCSGDRADEAGGVGSIAAAARASLRDHWFPEHYSLAHHDDGRRLMGAQASPRGSKKSGEQPSDETFAGEFDAEATGLAALAAMPDPVPLPVVLSLLSALARRVSGLDSRTTEAKRHGDALRESSSWLAAGGSGGEQHSTTATTAQRGGGDTAAVGDFVEAVVTYAARAYWLLRPRLDDSAFLVWATVERSMAVFPTANGVWQQQWDRMCRGWRLPASTTHATAVAGAFLSASQRHRVAAWCARLREHFPSLQHLAVLAPGKEEEAVLSYMRSMTAYTHLLSLTMRLLMRHRLLGDLIKGSEDIVRERLQLSRWKSTGGAGGAAAAMDEQSFNSMRRRTVEQEVRRLAQERQTQQALVNRNLLESAALQYLNVAWTLVRHGDSLTHRSTDMIVAQLTQTQGAKAGRAANMAAASSRDPADLIGFAEELRRMVATVLQDTLSSILSTAGVTRVFVMGDLVTTLFISGFSCDPLLLRVPAHSQTGSAAGSAAGATTSGTAPAVTVVATLLDAVGSAAAMSSSSSSSGGGGGAALSSSAAAVSSAHRALNPITRAELYVGSPTLLAMLTPFFTQDKLLRSLGTYRSPVALQPVVSSLEHYLSRHDVPLSPLLEATTELLTCGAVRSSALHTYCEHLASELTTRKEFRQALEPPTIASVEQGGAGSISNEVVIAFVAAIARRDVHITKKTLATLLHLIMTKRLDVFGQPPTANRQGKLTLVQVGTTVETTIDTTNPLYSPRRTRATATGAANHTGASTADTDASLTEDDATAVMEAFNVDHSTDFTAMTHHKALAALTIDLPTVLEVAMHIDAMRTLDAGELRRARQMLKAADDARRERVAMHRSLAQMAAPVATAVAAAAATSSTAARTAPTGGGKTDVSSKRGGAAAAAAAVAPVGVLDASLHLEDPLDYGVAVLHLRYALRKVVHASLRRLLHQQGPRMLAEVADMLQMTDPGMQQRPDRGSHGVGDGGKRRVGEADVADQRPRPYDGILAGTTRVLLSRALLCAQAIGYDTNGAVLELPGPSSQDAAEGQPVLKLPVPELQVSAVEAAISAMGTARGRHAVVGTSSGKLGQLTKEEKAAVHQRVELEREAAVTVGATTHMTGFSAAQRITRALRSTRRTKRLLLKARDFNRQRGGTRRPPLQAFSGSRSSSPSVAGPSSSSRSRASLR